MSNQASRKAVATRNDVARVARVSPALVSYVVNGTKPVARETAERVRQAIEMLGYRPNSAARSLRLGATETLGMVVPNSANPFFAALAHQVELAAIERGYGLLVANTNDVLALEDRHIEHFSARRVDGVLLCSSVFEPDLSPLRQVGIPVVLLNHPANAPGASSVGVDLERGAALAVEHLASHGYRRIGLVGGIMPHRRRDLRQTGWLQSLSDLGLTPGPIVEVQFSARGGYEAGQQLIASANLPPAIFASSDRQAIGLLRALHEGRRRIPEDVAVVGFDGSEDGAYSWPPLTSVVQPIAEMARAAVSALINEGDETLHQMFEPTLLIKRSCGC